MKYSLFRLFIALLMSFNMVTGQNIALAEGIGEPDPEIPVAPSPQINTDAQGYNQEDGAYSLIKRVEVDNSDFLTEVSTLSAILLGADMVMDCQKLNVDMWIYLGGSVAYLGLLILANKKLDDAQNHALVSLSGDKESDLEILNTMRTGEDNRLKATRLKFTAHTAMTVAYLTADIFAWIEVLSEIAEGVTSLGTKFKGTQNAPTCSTNDAVASIAVKAVLSYITGMAGGSGILTTAISLATTIFKKTTHSLITLTDTIPANSIPRAIFYAVATGIAGASMIHTGKKKSQIKDNIEDLDVMIASYRATTPGNTVEPGGGTTGDDDWNSLFPELTLPATPGGIEDPGTTAMRDLNNIQTQDIQIPTSINSPTLANSVAGLNAINRSMRSGQYGAAVTAAEGLGRNIAKLKEIRDDIKLKVAEKLKKAGKPSDFAAQSQSLAEKLNNASGQALQQAGATNKLSEKEEPKKEEVKSGGGSAQGAIVTTQSNLEPAGEEMLFEEGWDKQEDLMALSTGNAGQNLSDYELNKRDINNDRSQSIFSVLSVRYLKTAYPQLLEEAK